MSPRPWIKRLDELSEADEIGALRLLREHAAAGLANCYLLRIYRRYSYLRSERERLNLHHGQDIKTGEV